MIKLSQRHALLSKTQLVHITCWISLIILEVVVAGAIKNRFSTFAYYSFFYALNIGLFYLHGMYVMPFSKQPGLQRIFKLGGLVIAEIILYLLGAMLSTIILRDVLHQYATSPSKFDFNYTIIVLYRALFFIAYGTGYYFLIEHLKAKDLKMQRALEVERLQNQLLKSEKDYLRAQVNPHLLFNTLDFIKAVSKKNPEQSDEAIDCLSEIMDYALKTSKQEFVELGLELDQIEHMIRLNMLRNENRLNLDFCKKIDNLDVEIIPIVLLTLVENIFKHGNLKDKTHGALIELSVSSQFLKFRTRNLIAKTLPSKKESTGLKNVIARLEQSYPGHHSFIFEKKGDLFFTDLSIVL